MKAIAYFIVLFLAAVTGYILINVVITILMTTIFGAIQGTNTNIFILKIVSFVFTFLKLSFFILLLYRVYVCIKNRNIIIPQQFTGVSYVIGAIAAIPFLLIASYYIVTILSGNAQGLSGIPLGIVIVPAGIISIVIVLRCEVSAIKETRTNVT